MTNETRANRPATPSQMVACAVVALTVLFLAVAVVGTLAADDRPNGERPPRSVAQSSDSGDDASDTPPAHSTAGNRNGQLLPYCSFEVTVIEGPPHEWFPTLTFTTGINELGAVCGHWSWIGPDKPFYWTPETGLVTLTMPAGFTEGFANDINDHMVVVGSMTGPNLPWRGFLYDITSDTWTILEPVVNEGSAGCWANAINNDGIVVGRRSIGDTQQPYNAFIWTPGPPEEGGGTYEDLGVMNGPNSSATDVSETGNVTGWTGSGFGAANALGFVYRNGDIELIDPVENGYQSAAHGINLFDEAAGRSRIESDRGTPPQPFHWIEGVTENIGTLPGDTMASAQSINDDSMIVGVSSGSDLNWRACVWYSGQIYNINDLLEPPDQGLTIRAALDISEGGLIAANGIQGGNNIGILLSPIPRPVGDLTGDCAVGVDDLLFLLSEWGKTESAADLNGDGLVDGADLGILLSNWTTR